MAKGDRLSLYDKVYRELDSTLIGAERQRNVKAKNKERYNFETEMGIDGDCIVVWGETPERLDLAQRIAEYYGAKFKRVDESWRSEPTRRYKIKINVMEE